MKRLYVVGIGLSNKGSPAAGQLQRPELRSERGKVLLFVAAEPPQTTTSFPQSGAAASMTCAACDVAGYRWQILARVEYRGLRPLHAEHVGTDFGGIAAEISTNIPLPQSGAAAHRCAAAPRQLPPPRATATSPWALLQRSCFVVL
jgi:hypothetical protein